MAITVESPSVERLTRAQHFQDGFPLAANRVHSHATCRLHTHEFSELVVVLRGTGLHVTPHGSWPIGAGDTFVLHGDQAHGYVDTASLDLVNIMFIPAELGLPTADVASLPGYHVLFTLEPLYRARDRFESRLRLTPDQLRHVAPMVDRLEHELKSRPPGWRFSALACFMLLTADLSRFYAHFDAPAAHGLQRLGSVISHLEQHYAEPLSLDELSAVGCMSRRHLSRVFRSALGCSPLDYLVRLRINKALELLTETDVPIATIAHQVGYADSNYFARQFRRVVGVSPRQAREAAGRTRR